MKTVRFALILTFALLPAGLVRAGDTAEVNNAPTETANTAQPRDNVRSQTGENLRLGQTGWIGIRVAPVSGALGKQLALPDATGLTVVNLIDNGPADKADIKRYDVIAAVNGKPVPAKPGAFVEQIVREKPGRRLRLEVIRGGKRLKKTVVVGRPRTLGAVRYKYDANGKPVQDVEAVQAKVFRKVNNNWVPEQDPNRIKEVLGRNNEAFSQLANADQSSNEAPAEAVGWTDGEGNRYVVNRSGQELTVVKEPVTPSAERGDGKLKAWNYDSPAEFRRADPNTHAQFAKLAQQQRAVSQASRDRISRFQLAQGEARGEPSGHAQRLAAAAPDTTRGGEKKGLPLTEGLADEIEAVTPELADKAKGETGRNAKSGEDEASAATGLTIAASEGKPRTRPAAPADAATADGRTRKLRESHSPDQTKAERRKLLAEIETTLAELAEIAKELRAYHHTEEFRVAEDGGITVIRRKGKSAIQMKFKNAKDLVDRAPGAYKRYRELHQSIEAK